MLERSLAAVVDVVATIPNVMFCVKSADGAYLAANQAFAERAGVSGPGDVVGRRAADLFPAELAERYERQDAAVLSTGRVLTNELEVITRPDRSHGWFLTSKSRWLGEGGEPAGVVSVSVDQRSAVDDDGPHAGLAVAIEVARRRFDERLQVADLADAAGMSVARLERTTRRVLGLAPMQLVLRFRLEEALRLLETTDRPISEIAGACGFYDQSALTRRFRRAVGTTPAAHRAASAAR